MVSGCLKNRIFIAVGFNQRNKKLKSLGFSLIMQANLGWSPHIAAHYSVG